MSEALALQDLTEVAEGVLIRPTLTEGLNQAKAGSDPEAAQTPEASH